MLKMIVVPLDGSPLSERALPFAARLTRAASAQLLLVRAAFTAGAAVVTNASAARIAAARLEVVRRTAEAEIATVAGRLRAEGVAVTTRVQDGWPSDTILDEARSSGADLIVMATHGRSGVGRYLYGSVAEELLQRAEVPLLLVPPICEEPWPTDRPLRILVPLDGSALAEEALGPGCELADALAADLLLLRVVHHGERTEATDYLAAVSASVRTAGRAVAVRAVVGAPPLAIAAVAQAESADLIAMASHGRSGLARLVLGSVATGTLQRTGVPLLIVRPAAIRAAAAGGSEAASGKESRPPAQPTGGS